MPRTRSHGRRQAGGKGAGPIELRNPGLLMDVQVKANGKLNLPFPSSWNSFAYVFDGNGTIGDTSVEVQHAVVLEHGDYLQAESSNDKVRA